MFFDCLRKRGSAFGLALLCLMVGCATIREVKKKPGVGGVITIKDGIYGDARLMARTKMRENCGSKEPVITEEGEAVVGSTSTSQSSKNTISGETEDKREWRLTYKCKGKKSK